MYGLDGAPIDLSRCPVQTPSCRTLLAEVNEGLEIAGLSRWDPLKEQGLIRNVILQADGEGGGIVVLVSTASIPPEPLTAFLPKREELGIFVDVLPAHKHDLLRRPLWVRGPRSLKLKVEEDQLRATLPAWTPQTPESLPQLRAAVLRLLAPQPKEKILEIGCGIGTLSLPIARAGAQLLGLDMDRAAVEDARYNAERNGVEGSSFRQGRAEKALRRLLAGGYQAEAVLLHAMRRPYGAQVMVALKLLGARRALYLAPNPSSLRRDLEALKGWSLESLEYLDQLPGTVHLLSLALLKRDR